MKYNVDGNYTISFEIPDFTNPAEVFTVSLIFYKCGSQCYTEYEPLHITIINTPPVLDGTLASEITIFDGLTGTLNYHATDTKNSHLLEIRFEGSPVPPCTAPPPWITLTPGGLFEASPKIK